MLTTILMFIIGIFVFSLVFKITFSILGLIFKLIGGVIFLPLLIIGGIILLPLIVIGLGISLIVNLLPFILGGGAIYFIYRAIKGREGYWYN